MKVECYEKAPLARGVDAMARIEADVPLAEVVERIHVNGAGREEEPGRAMFRHRRFRVRAEEGEPMEFTGFLVYERRRDILDFLSSRYIPSGNSRLDAIARSSSREDLRDRLGEELIDLAKADPMALFQLHHRGRHHAVLSRTDFSHLDLNDEGCGRRFFRKGGERLVVAAERNVAYGSHRVPRRLSAVFYGSKRSRGCVWFDGERFGHADSVEELPEALARELDLSGRPHGEESPLPLPRAPVAPLFLLRVPTKSEAKPLLGNGAVRKSAPPRPNPFFLFDTRDPVPLPAGLPVVDDPREALSILGRVSDNAYVPSDLASAPVRLRNEPAWRVACAVAP